jgi:hypothetical protein
VVQENWRVGPSGATRASFDVAQDEPMWRKSHSYFDDIYQGAWNLNSVSSRWFLVILANIHGNITAVRNLIKFIFQVITEMAKLCMTLISYVGLRCAQYMVLRNFHRVRRRGNIV